MEETEVRYVCTSADCAEHCSFCTSFNEHDIGDSFVKFTCPRGFNIKWVRIDDYSNFVVGDVYLDTTDNVYYEVEDVLDNCVLLHKWDNPEVFKDVHNTNTLVKRRKRPLCMSEIKDIIGQVAFTPEDSSFHLITGCGCVLDDGPYAVIDGVRMFADDLMEDKISLVNGTPLYKIEED